MASAKMKRSKSKPVDSLDDNDSARADAERKLKKQARRAEKLSKRLLALGLDEYGNELDNFCIVKYPVREWKFTLPGTQESVALNPVVTLIAIVCLWGTVYWSTADPLGSLDTLLSLRTSVATSFSWFFLGSKAIFLFFLLYTLYRFGHLHMGRKNDKPDFSMLQMGVMMFAAGTGPVLYVLCMSDTFFHQHSHYYAQAGYRSQDEVDMFAINMTICGWTINTWPTFSIVAVASALSVHRFGLPLAFRSCFFPLLGAYTWGWMGDMIDGLAIVVMLLGLTINLCWSTIQISSGFVYLGLVDEHSSEEEIILVQKVTVWVTTFISVASVISGLHGGIRFMSNLAMALTLLLSVLVLAMDDTKFILNLQVQTFGYHLQTSMFQLNFWTDAFGQLKEGSGRAVDGKAGEEWWIGAWPLFFQAWTSCLACIFGVFVACISKGRKLWELILLCLFVPSAICILWFCLWGGIGLRQARQAMELEVLGETYFNNSAHFLVDGSSFCYDVPQDDVVIDGATIFTNRLPGVTPVCQFDDTQPNLAALNVLSSFRFPGSFGNDKGLGPALIVLFLTGCTVMYITMSDSASLMVDSLASNARKNNHWSRRLFWASTVGALTTALLSRSGADAIKAIESGLIVCALPVAILLCFMVQSILLFCQEANKPDVNGVEEPDYQFPNQPEFAMPVYGGIFNVFEYVASLGKVNVARIELGMHAPTRFQVVEFVKGLVVPFVSLSQILNATYPQNPQTNSVTVMCYAVGYISWTTLFLASLARAGLLGMATTMFFLTGGALGLIRSGLRTRSNLRSHHVADWIVGTFLWPQALAQMRQHCVSLSKCKQETTRKEVQEELENSENNA